MKKIITITITLLLLISCTSKTSNISSDDNHISENETVENSDMDEPNMNIETIEDEPTQIIEEDITKIVEKNDDIVSDTKNKKIIFFGDSIVKGYNNDKYSWVNYFAENYDFSECINAGIIDYRLSTYDDPNKWLVDEVKSYIGNDYDYVILEGGINDVFHDTPIGEIKNYDKDTFIGGLETYLKTVKDNWPNSKIGYIITFYAPNYTENGMMWSVDDYKKYYDVTKDVLDRWGIPYLDLSSDYYVNLLNINDKKYLVDYLHPNRDGYIVISPYIYEWILTLK